MRCFLDVPNNAIPPHKPRTPRALLLLILCVAPLTACTSAETERATLRTGFDKYSLRQVDESEAIATKFITDNPNSPNLDEALYLRGLSRLTRGNKAAAAEDFRQAIQKTTRPDLKAKAFRALGDISYETLQWADAQKSYESALSSGGATPANTTYLNYRVGACLQAQGQWTPAEPWFARVIAANNDATLRERALARMHATGYSLQFGAFQEGPKASELANQLRTNGITPAITSETREDKVLLLVRSGSYRTWQEADAARDKMLAKYPLVAIVP